MISLRLKPFFESNGLCPAYLDGSWQILKAFYGHIYFAIVASLKTCYCTPVKDVLPVQAKKPSSGSCFSILSSDLSGKNFLF
jgi:hypothetical protein